MSKSFKKDRVIWYRSLAFTISLMFLPLSLIPILIISYDNYSYSKASLEKTSYHDIEQASILEKKFIDNWFDYRIVDIQNWSESRLNIEFLEELIDGYDRANTTLNEYMKSDEYIHTIIDKQNDIVKIAENYGYLYDVLLIDTDGNILYSVEQEDDFGANLLHGRYSQTKFADAFRQTMEDEKVHFSDLEFYRTSDKIVTGFLTAPIINKYSELIGSLAIQIKLDKIYALFNDSKYERDFKEFSHYLVGSDGVLRSKIMNDSEILRLKVGSKQLELLNLEDDENAVSYKNIKGEDVLGIHENIDILGVKWILVSEAKVKAIDEVTQLIINKTIISFVLIMLTVIIISLFISRFLVKPILLLTNATTRFTDGQRELELEINTEDEIGLLSREFKELMGTIDRSEKELLKAKLIAEDSVKAKSEFFASMVP